MKKILITGASGFFGKSLIQALKKTSYNFKCILLYKKHPLKISDTRFEEIQCDLFNKNQTKHLLREISPTHLVHLAWYVNPHEFWTSLENINWMEASLNLFRIFCENKGKLFIGAGSLAEYNWEEGSLNETTTPLLPASLYGQCKKSLHEILIQTRNIYYPKTKIIWPRIGYFFGENEPKEKLISKLINCIKTNSPINLSSSEFKRPYAHIQHFGNIIEKLLMANEFNDLTFNLSSSNSYPLKEIVGFIETILQKPSSKIHYGAYPASPIDLSVDVTSLKMLELSIPDTFFIDLRNMIGNLNEDI